MEKKMLKRSMAVWMVLVLLFISAAPVALTEGDAASAPETQETAGEENNINEETSQLLDETDEMVDNVTDELSSAMESAVEAPAEEALSAESEMSAPTADDLAAEESAPSAPAADAQEVIYLYLDYDAHMYSRPSTSGKWLCWIPGPSKLEVIDYSGHWAKVEYYSKADDKLYVGYVDCIQTPPADAGEETADDVAAAEDAAAAAEDTMVNETVVVDSFASDTNEVMYDYVLNDDGSIALDASGNPMPIVPEGAEVPVNYLRDEDGNLVLLGGKPVVTATVPVGASVIATIRDQLDPDRSIDIYAAWEGDQLYFDTEATLIAVLYGYENAVYTLQWQYSADDVEWHNLENATDERCKVTVTEENYLYFWRVLVIISDIME